MVKISTQNYIRNQCLQQELGLKVLTPEELKSLQMVLLEIYQEIQRICDKYSLKVLLGGGSALGAVRHKGFIPWDDDMDLMMIREDYDRFVEVFEREADIGFKLKENGFSLHVIKKNTKYVGLLDSSEDDTGIYVDIFPIDYVSNNLFYRILKGAFSDLLLFVLNSRNLYLSSNKYLKTMFSQTFQARLIFSLRKGVGYLFSEFSLHAFLRIHRKLVVQKIPTKWVTIPSGRKHYFGELLEYSVFYPASSACFEQKKCAIPNRVDLYLINLYGEDYMELPPEEKRETHPCLAFDSESCH